MWRMTEKQHVANPETRPGPGWLQAQEVHYMMAFKVAITVTPDNSVKAQSPCIKLYTQIQFSVPTMQRFGILPKKSATTIVGYVIQALEDPSISRLLK